MFLAVFYVQNHPFLFNFGGWGLRFYSLAYLTGFLITYYGLFWQARKGWSLLRGEAISEFVLWVALGVILGGRIGYCLMYAPLRTFTDWKFFFSIWNGGMASHGGILGVILVMMIFARAYKIPFYNLADAGALFTPVALGLGRCANFLNGELWGRPTTVAWGVVFPDAPWINGMNVPRHPSQLYEAFLEGLVLQTILLIVRYQTKIEGGVALTFMACYAILRMIGEQFREPDADINYWFGTITQGQLLSGIMLLLTGVLAYAQFFAKKSFLPRV